MEWTRRDLRAKADQIAAIAETRATIARLSQRRAESIQLAHVLRNAIDSIEGAGHGGAHDGASRQRQTD